jgi:RHS repeat-associated protein
MRANPRDITPSCLSDERRRDLASHVPNNPLFPRSCSRSCSRSFRYGFNGKEVDSEINGNGNAYDFGARMYDSRLGRWWSVDPLHKKYPSYSLYSFGLDCPIYFRDSDGRVIIDANGKEVTVNQDDKGNITFNTDIAPETLRLLNYFLQSETGKSQLKKIV